VTRLRPGGDEFQGGQRWFDLASDGFGEQTCADALGFAAAAERGEMGRDGLTDANSCAVPARIKRSRAETERECAHGYVCARLVRESRGV
jgi:hypothetical protein